jgi:hypothetical protein
MAKKAVTYTCVRGGVFKLPVIVAVNLGQHVYLEFAGPMSLGSRNFIMRSDGSEEVGGILHVRVPVPADATPGTYHITKFELRAFLGTVEYPENYYSHVHLNVLEMPPAAPPPDMPPAFIGR